MGNGLEIAVDVGGTFTDITLLTDLGGRFTVKLPTDLQHPERGFAAGVARVAELASAPSTGIQRVTHATTLVTNTILEQTGGPVALVTTRGFRHVLEIGRHDGPRRTSMLAWQKPARPIPPAHVFEVGERLASDGSTLIPLDEDACRAVGIRLRDLGFGSIAISFINSYVSPRHEERAAQLIAEAHPDALLSLSSRVLPTFREYERTLATALDAYVRPTIDQYLASVDEFLHRENPSVHTFVMQSNGGHLSTHEARRRPVSLALSGPAASAMAAGEVARRARLRWAIAMDMGGTSTDVSVLAAGEPEMTDEAHVGPWPFALSSVDVRTVGAGGGSVARVTVDGSIRVGPDSVGSSPGPACYGRGGTRPTVTDANLVLGRLPDRLAGGQVVLDPKLSEQAIARHLSEPLGIDLESAAAGVLAVVNNNMVGAIRLVTTERGRDPRGFALIAGGGAGPLHAAEVAKLLGCSHVVIPPSPGVLSTQGLLESPLRRVFVTTHLRLLRECTSASIASIFGQLESEAGGWFEAEGVAQRSRHLTRHASARFYDQSGEILIGWPGLDKVESTLHRAHRDLYGYAPDNQPAELVSLRVVATARRTRRAAPRATPPESRPARVRQLQLGGGETVPADIYERSSLGLGFRCSGPAVIEQMDSTTYVPPKFTCWADSYGNLVLASGSKVAFV